MFGLSHRNKHNTAMPVDSHKPYSHNYKILFYDDYDEKDVCIRMKLHNKPMNSSIAQMQRKFKCDD